MGRVPAGGEVVMFAIYPPEKTMFSGAFNITLSVPQFALSPDGRTIVFVARADGERPLLWRRSLDQLVAKALPGTEDAEDPFWSPDSRWIGFAAEGKLKKTPAAGGAVQVVVPTTRSIRGGTWGNDDAIVFSTGNDPLQRVAATGGKPTLIDKLMPGEVSRRFPVFLPDGRRYLYLSLGTAQNALYAGALDDTGAKLVTRMNNSAIYASPGYLVFAEGGILFGQPFDAARLETDGEPFVIAEHVGRSTTFESAISVSDTGTIAYAGTLLQKGTLTWFDRTGQRVNSMAPEGSYSDFRVSPNGKLLAASMLDDKTGNIDIWMTDLARGARSRVTADGGFNSSPIWSPDSTQLLFRTFQKVVEFHQKSAAGGGSEQTVLSYRTVQASGIPTNNTLIDTDWSPDGKNILFTVENPSSGSDVWVLPQTGDKKAVNFLTSPADEMHGNFSPDGRLVAYTSNDTGKYQVNVQTLPLSDRKWQVSTSGGYEPRWRADGHEIYYLSEDRKLMAVEVGTGPSFGIPKALFQTQVQPGVTRNHTHYVPSRDGQRFLVNTLSADASPTPITIVMNWAARLKK